MSVVGGIVFEEVAQQPDTKHNPASNAHGSLRLRIWSATTGFREKLVQTEMIWLVARRRVMRDGGLTRRTETFSQ
jgi:hypothetical protein